jgi:hypothetical protein
VNVATKADVENHFNTHGTGEITEIKLMNGFGFIEYKDSMDARDVVPGASHALTFAILHHARFANAACSFPYVYPHLPVLSSLPSGRTPISLSLDLVPISCSRMLTYIVGCFQMDPSSWESVLSCSSLVAATVRATTTATRHAWLRVRAALSIA